MVGASRIVLKKIKTQKKDLAVMPKINYTPHMPNSTPNPTPAPTTFDAKASLARTLVDPRWKSKGPTIGEFVKRPRPLMRGGRDVS